MVLTTPLTLYNSLTKRKERFEPQKRGHVRIYVCGPTVYEYAHIGNFRAFLAADTLVRTLRYRGYKTTYIRNITDVGHLTDDADQGEDKVEKSAVSKGISALEVGDMFTKVFQGDALALNLLTPDKEPRASEHIEEQILMIRELEKRGFTYRAKDGIYFDTAKMKGYGKLASLDLHTSSEGRIASNPEKKNPRDFALWKFSPEETKRQMEWPSPWGVGFPGWHIECSAMSRKYLGFPFDIHMGGIDHASVHHTNEIAQNEGVFGGQTVKFWLHSEFVLIDGKKMSKSLGNTYTLKDVAGRGISLLAFRYMTLNTHYRQKLNFTWDALIAAENSLNALYDSVEHLTQERNKVRIGRRLLSAVGSLRNIAVRGNKIQSSFENSVADDLNTPQALAALWELIKSPSLSPSVKLSYVRRFDQVLGLNLTLYEDVVIPPRIQDLIREREVARKKTDWPEADRLRDEIAKLGYALRDTEKGPIITKIKK